MARLKVYEHQVVYPIAVYHAYQKFLVLTLAPPLHTQRIPDKLCVFSIMQHQAHLMLTLI